VAPIPDELLDLVITDVLAHVTLSAADGSLVTHVLWIDYDGEHLKVWSRLGSHKGTVLRERPNVAVSVVDPHDPWRRLSITGRATGFQPDPDVSFMDALSARYVGGPYPRRAPGEVILITPDRVRAFRGRFSGSIA
jgi:hypothetical protein